MSTQAAVESRPAALAGGKARTTPWNEDLELVLHEIMATGAFNDRELLARLVRASQAALRAVREVGACGYRCPTPGLHCPVKDGALDDTLEQVLIDGFELAPATSAALATPACVCGQPMVAVAVTRGEEVQAWAGCDTCYHWVPLGAGR
jgi:hypothetical protein